MPGSTTARPAAFAHSARDEFVLTLYVSEKLLAVATTEEIPISVNTELVPEMFPVATELKFWTVGSEKPANVISIRDALAGALKAKARAVTFMIQLNLRNIIFLRKILLVAK